MTAPADSGPRVRILPSVPAARRLPSVLAFVASIGVFVTSLRPLPAGWLVALACAWLLAVAAGATAPRRGPLILTVLAAVAKVATVVLVVRAVAHPHGRLGPHTALAWVSLGVLNVATGLWLLTVIRRRVR
ncbi:hypothetical protein ACIGXM_11190 [Kitasatospora sp. NPDC052896]|uniref:hypothetical protein n=1 Tax=Kitasatospora sp. NPDC052896 TaxID=3364061 RepID=UPI0037C711FE